MNPVPAATIPTVDQGQRQQIVTDPARTDRSSDLQIENFEVKTIRFEVFQLVLEDAVVSGSTGWILVSSATSWGRKRRGHPEDDLKLSQGSSVTLYVEPKYLIDGVLGYWSYHRQTNMRIASYLMYPPDYTK
jgi:hypothetical protein